MRSIVGKDLRIRGVGEDGVAFDTIDQTNVLVLHDTVFEGTIGDGDDALVFFETGGDSTVSATVENRTTNAPAPCEGTFTGRLRVLGNDAQTIVDGAGCM